MSLLGQLSNINLECFKETSKFSNGVFSNGIWQRRDEPVGVFIIQKEKFDGKLYGLTKDCEVSFQSKLPKMPATILINIIKFFQEIQSKFNSEVYISIYWDKVKQDYFLFVPTQEVSGAAVHFENDYEMLNNSDIFIVADLHSHNNFGAFRSAQDIKDESASRLFGIIGKVNSTDPEILLYAASNRQTVDLKIEDIFDTSLEKLHEVSDYSIDTEEQLTKISEIRVKTYPAVKTASQGKIGHAYQDDYYGGYYGGYNNYNNYDTTSNKTTVRKSASEAKTAYGKSLYYTGLNTNAFTYFSSKFRSFMQGFSPVLNKEDTTIIDKKDMISSLFYSFASLVFEEIDYNGDIISIVPEEFNSILESIKQDLDLTAKEYIFDSSSNTNVSEDLDDFAETSLILN